jgi:hypothetical protein
MYVGSTLTLDANLHPATLRSRRFVIPAEAGTHDKVAESAMIADGSVEATVRS